MPRSLSFGLWIIVAILSASPGHAQSTSRGSFEVAAVKLNSHCDGSGGRGGLSPTRLDIPCQSLRALIRSAYGAFDGGKPRSRRLEVLEGPNWIDTERYDVSVKSEGEALPAQMMGVLQKVLEERFRLKVHTEPRDSPVYELTVARDASKLHHSPEGSCTPVDLDDLSKRGVNNTGRPGEQVLRNCGTGSRNGDGTKWIVNGYGVNMGEFAGRMLSSYVDRPVIDKTGLAGRFDVHLEFASNNGMSGPVQLNGAAIPGSPAPSDKTTAPSIFTALQEQLGLRLSPAKGAMEVIVIDHVEKPSAN